MYCNCIILRLCLSRGSNSRWPPYRPTPLSQPLQPPNQPYAVLNRQPYIFLIVLNLKFEFVYLNKQIQKTKIYQFHFRVQI